MNEPEALVGVIRPNGQAMFHTQDCAHAKRAMSAHHYLPSDFAPGDLWCSACRPDLITSASACAADPVCPPRSCVVAAMRGPLCGGVIPPAKTGDDR